MDIKDIKIIITAVFGGISAAMGNLALPVYVMVGANILDYITGLMAAPYRGEVRTSYRSMKGITKKIMMWALVALGVGLDILLGYAVATLGVSSIPPFIGACCAVWISCNEALSILENIRDTGTPTPLFLQKLIEKLKLTVEDSVKSEDEE